MAFPIEWESAPSCAVVKQYTPVVNFVTRRAGLARGSNFSYVCYFVRWLLFIYYRAIIAARSARVRPERNDRRSRVFVRSGVTTNNTRYVHNETGNDERFGNTVMYGLFRTRFRTKLSTRARVGGHK